jgi:hypothetical protein
MKTKLQFTVMSTLLFSKKRRLESEEDFLSSLDTCLTSNMQRGADNFSLGIFLTDGNLHYSRGWLRKLINNCVLPSEGLSSDDKDSLRFLRAVLLGSDSKWVDTIGAAFGYSKTVIRRVAIERVSNLVKPGVASEQRNLQGGFLFLQSGQRRLLLLQRNFCPL